MRPGILMYRSFESESISPPVEKRWKGSIT